MFDFLMKMKKKIFLKFWWMVSIKTIIWKKNNKYIFSQRIILLSLSLPFELKTGTNS